MSRIVGKIWQQRLMEINRGELDCLADISKPGTGYDNNGQPITTPEVLATDVPCRLARWETQPMSGEFGDQIVARSRWVVTFDVGERRAQEQHLLDVSGSTNGVPWVRHLKVVEPLDPSSVEIMSQVLCDEA